MLKTRVRRAFGEVAHTIDGRQYGRRGRLIILMYHAVTADVVRDPAQLATPLSLFRQQMIWLRELGVPIVSLSEGVSRLRESRLDQRVVALTFDDGYLNTYSLAFPVLEELGYPATVFLVPKVMGQRHADFAPAQLGPFMDWGHAREMQCHGIDFGSHSLTHRQLASLPLEDVEDEMRRSKNIIEQALSRPLDGFCYPFGSYGAFTKATEACGLELGYRYLATSLAGHNVKGGDVTRLKRLRMSWLDDCRREVQKQCAGSYNWYRFYEWTRWRIRHPHVAPAGRETLA